MSPAGSTSNCDLTGRFKARAVKLSEREFDSENEFGPFTY